jgi:hypothetical protein
MAYITLSPTKTNESYGGPASNTQWEDVTRGKGFVGSGSNTFTVSVTAHPDVDEYGIPIEVVLFTGIDPSSFERHEEPQIATSNSVTTATVTGRYLNQFEDTLKYLNPGKAYCNGYFATVDDLPPQFANNIVTANTMLVETPTTVVGFGNLPANTNLFYLSGDTRTYVTASYTVTVIAQPIGGGANTTDTFSCEHDIYNDWEFYVIRISEHKKTFVNYTANNYSYSNSLMQSTYSGYLY